MNAGQQLSVLIVDDERAARQRLEELLALEPHTEVVGTARNGREAVEAIARLKPDLVLLDVQMPGLSGIEVVREIGPANMPAVVFVTAYDQHAISAFELAAVDYLLKPFADERFGQAMERARQNVRLRRIGGLQDGLRVLLGASAPPPAAGPASARYLERIAVETRGQVRVVPVERVDFITADGSYVDLHVGEDTFLIREKMQVLEERLDPDRFFRIHRSTIVQLDRIERLLYGSGGDYSVRLRDGRNLRVSRGRYAELQQRLGLLSDE